MKTALSIAGSDCGEGAGIQPDLKTMTMNGVCGMSAITALTAQNTTGVSAITEVTPEFLQQQTDMIFDDIPPDAVKIGMVPSPALMVSSSGADLMQSAVVKTLKEKLLPPAALATPNIPESEVPAGMTIRAKGDRIAAATTIRNECGCALPLKSGHSIHNASDLLCAENRIQWFHGWRIDNPNTHGTGCTLSVCRGAARE